jgi:hypothetical protein
MSPAPKIKDGGLQSGSIPINLRFYLATKFKMSIVLLQGCPTRISQVVFYVADVITPVDDRCQAGVYLHAIQPIYRQNTNEILDVNVA